MIRRALRYFDVRNLVSVRNLWAAGVGTLVLTVLFFVIPVLVLGEWILFLAPVLWLVLMAWALLMLGAYAVPRCDWCGTRLRAGFYTCPSCTKTSLPRVMR